MKSLDWRMQYLGHADLVTVRKQTIPPPTEGLDETENVVPSTAVQSSRVITQLIQNLVHLEDCRESLNQNCGFDAATRNTEGFLSCYKDTVPQSCLSRMLHFGEVKEWTVATMLCTEVLVVVEEVKAKVHQTSRHRTAINFKVGFCTIHTTKCLRT